MGSVNSANNRVSFLFAALALIATGCLRPLSVKENLSEGQITDLKVIRKPSPEKTLGIVPRYDDYLEGYLRGGVVNHDGKPVAGAIVKVSDSSGRPSRDFGSGVTDQNGEFRLRFSLPIRWNRLDFTGKVRLSGGWDMISPRDDFRVYFNRKNGVLAYFPKEFWIPGRARKAESAQDPKVLDKLKKSLKPPPGKKEPGDIFDDMGFEP